MNARHLPLLLLALAGVPVFAADSAPLLLPAAQDVAGATQAQWTRRWSQWALSFDREVSPLADATGAHCSAGQQGPVWFLAGSFGGQRVARKCTVPAGKYLFFPLINFVAVPPDDRPGSCDIETRDARRLTDGVDHLVLRIDGQPQAGLEAHRVDSQGCFDAGARMSPPVDGFPSAGNGYYAMLKPLSPGTHEIEFGATLPAGSQAIRYTLLVR